MVRKSGTDVTRPRYTNGIAVGEPNPSTPRSPPKPRIFPMGGVMAGYTGPKPGTPAFKAARAAGQHPIMDYLKSQRPVRILKSAGSFSSIAGSGNPLKTRKPKA